MKYQRHFLETEIDFTQRKQDKRIKGGVILVWVLGAMLVFSIAMIIGILIEAVGEMK